MNKLKKLFLQGLAVSLPVFLTFYIIFFVARFFYNLMDFGLILLPESYRSNLLFSVPIVLGTMLLAILFTAFIGSTAKTLFGRVFQQYLSVTLISIPIVKSIYLTFKQFFDILFVGKNKTFSRPALVPFPHHGKVTIGFATGETEIQKAPGETTVLVRVFVPTVPNPTTGFLMLFEKNDVTFPDLTSEEALRLILSGGILHHS